MAAVDDVTAGLPDAWAPGLTAVERYCRLRYRGHVAEARAKGRLPIPYEHWHGDSHGPLGHLTDAERARYGLSPMSPRRGRSPLHPEVHAALYA